MIAHLPPCRYTILRTLIVFACFFSLACLVLCCFASCAPRTVVAPATMTSSVTDTRTPSASVTRFQYGATPHAQPPAPVSPSR